MPKVAALAGLLAAAACTSTQSQPETADAALPRPQVVMVEDFAVSPDEVKLDDGVIAEVKAAAERTSATPRPAQEEQAGQQVADAIANNLVTEIRDLGLQAERGSAVPSGTPNTLLITGQLVSIDEGNRAERVAIGLGAGRSDVRAHVQVYEVTPAGRRLIDTIEVDAKSGLAPGMAETMGAGGLAGHLLVATIASSGLHLVSEKESANIVADADRAAKGIAKQLAALFRQQGWTT
jgi:hypothetical protein